MSAVLLGFTDGNHDARRLPRPEDYDDLIWFGSPEVRGDEFVAAATWSVDDWRTPLERALLDPTLELFGYSAQQIAADRILFAIRAEETDYPLGLLEG